MKNLAQWIQENIRHNSTKNFDHIEDPYLKDKLDSGLIKYEPEEWSALIELSEKDEKEMERKGVRQSGK